MAGSSAMHGEHAHTRSISFPNRLHSDALNIEIELNKLRASARCYYGAEAIRGGMVRLTELFPRVERLIQCPSTQQALYHHVKLVDDNLDASVALLDACGNIKELCSTMREQVQNLMSGLRRKGCNAVVECSVHSYICFRKKMKKDIAKCLESLKKMDRYTIPCPVILELSVVKVLLELKNGIISMFRAILLFLSMPVIKARSTGWLLISKLMQTGSVVSKGKTAFNEVGDVDVAVYNLQHDVLNAKVDLQGTQRRLETLNEVMDVLEAGLDSLLRCLIRYRVWLLNIITP